MVLQSKKCLVKNQILVEEVVQRDQDICMWITEEKMEVWQIDLYHRNTEDDGIHIQRNQPAIGSRPNDRFNLRDREKVKDQCSSI